MKRTVFLVAALFALMAVGVYAQTEADFTVKKSADGKSIEITGYKGSATAVSIPTRIQNVAVTSIGPDAFSGNDKITSVVIPNGVTSIGITAFSECTSLASVKLPSALTTIGDFAFDGCTSLDGILLPGNLTSIGKCAFQNCKSLTSVNTNKVTSMGEGAFTDCTSLARVTTESGLTSIEQYTFTGCTSLASVQIGRGVQSIKQQAFAYCDSLTDVFFIGRIPSTGFHATAFQELGDLRDKYYATDKTNGTPGNYTRPNATSTTWTRQ